MSNRIKKADWKYGGITDAQRDTIAKLLELGLKQSDIVKTLNISSTTVSKLNAVIMAVKNEDWEAYKTLRASIKGNAMFDWALKRYGKTIPEEPKPAIAVKSAQPENEAQNDKLLIQQIKDAVSTTITESCKCNVEQIDKDQMARIMLALGRISGSLEVIIDKLDDLTEAWK